jgi:hypothetical protein
MDDAAEAVGLAVGAGDAVGRADGAGVGEGAGVADGRGDADGTGLGELVPVVAEIGATGAPEFPPQSVSAAVAAQSISATRSRFNFVMRRA